MAERDGKECRQTVCFDGLTYDAEQAYVNLFRTASESITVIDGQTGMKTLRMIGAAGREVPVIVYTDNTDEDLRLTREDLKNFFARNPGMRLLIGTLAGKYSNRYIILDSGTQRQKVYLLSASPSDPSVRSSCIIELKDTQFVAPMLKELEENSYLVLK